MYAISKDTKVTLRKGRRTQADNLNLSVHFGALSVQKSVGLMCTDKLHSVRLLTIWYFKIRYISEKVYVIVGRLDPFISTFQI